MSASNYVPTRSSEYQLRFLAVVSGRERVAQVFEVFEVFGQACGCHASRF